MSDLSRLLPCPFCGSTAKCTESYDQNGPYATVICIECGSSSARHYSDPDEARSLAAEDWNRRNTTESTIVKEIEGECRRQVDTEGFIPESDDPRKHGGLAILAANYAAAASLSWPMGSDQEKRGAPRRMLIKAAALIVTSIERIDRAATQPQNDA